MPYYFIYIALILVMAVLVLGVINMMRGTNKNRSQQLMRWRVLLQFVALMIVVIVVFCIK